MIFGMWANEIHQNEEIIEFCALAPKTFMTRIQKKVDLGNGQFQFQVKTHQRAKGFSLKAQCQKQILNIDALRKMNNFKLWRNSAVDAIPFELTGLKVSNSILGENIWLFFALIQGIIFRKFHKRNLTCC